MNKYFLYIMFGAIFLGGIVVSARLFTNEDTWICQAGAWILHGKPLAGVPTKPCNGKATVYLDVRRDDEWAAGHIKGAVHFELSRLQTGEAPNIPKTANLQIYCKSGNRAGIAKGILKNMGFANAVNAGGFEDLRNQGFPVEY